MTITASISIQLKSMLLRFTSLCSYDTMLPEMLTNVICVLVYDFFQYCRT